MLGKWLGILKDKLIDASYIIWKKAIEFENQLHTGTKYKHWRESQVSIAQAYKFGCFKFIPDFLFANIVFKIKAYIWKNKMHLFVTKEGKSTDHLPVDYTIYLLTLSRKI